MLTNLHSAISAYLSSQDLTLLIIALTWNGRVH